MFIIKYSFLLSIYTVLSLGIKIYGPGLEPDKIVLPARYFFIETKDYSYDSFEVTFDGVGASLKPCRIWSNILNRLDGSWIVRYRLYETCTNFGINIKYKGQHVGGSPFIIKHAIQPDDCECPNTKLDLKNFLDTWSCGKNAPTQIVNDLEGFPAINWDNLRDEVIETYSQHPLSVSICHYVIKDEEIYRKCYGKYVGFNMFMDSILLALKRKTVLPNLEFFVNLGDWPLVTHKTPNFPIFSWCGSTDTLDILMPTYDITESTLENMGRVTLDMLSVQGNVKNKWAERAERAFWRGRDSNKRRLELVKLSREFPDLFNVSMTNFFFYRDKIDEYGPKSEHVSFFDFFNYKYQISIDGTVAAYRLPYLLAGGSLLLKKESKYHEHFYHDLIQGVHYIGIKDDLSDLVEKLRWARKNDREAEQIAKNGQKFANQHLLPTNIFCYYAHLLGAFSERIKNQVNVSEGMEHVVSKQVNRNCLCDKSIIEEKKEEL